MYNLLVHAAAGTWDKRAAVLDRPRFLEYTDQDIADSFEQLNARAIRKLTSMPTLFAYEEPVKASAHVGWIESIQVRQQNIRITFRMEPSFNPVRHKRMKDLEWELDIGKMELFRTHWAIKDVDLSQVLRHANLVRQSVILPAGGVAQSGIKRKKKGRRSPADAPTKVFVVHGRNNRVKNNVAQFLKEIGLEPIILHQQPNGGRTLISKFQEVAADVEFAVVLMTPDDLGGIKGRAQRPRSRQNVIFELGFFIGKIGSPKVCALVAGEVEKPSDFDAVVYIEYSRNSRWKAELAREIRHAGIVVDPESIA